MERRTCWACGILIISLLLGLPSKAKALQVLESVEQTSLLKSRFRVDYLMESITMVIHREYNSEPVVLITPDGTKWYSFRHPTSVKWVTGEVGDIIKIYAPTPGPWQVVGDVEPHSYIKVFSRTGVNIEELPSQLFEGEILKVTANLYGEDLPIRMKGLDYLMDWTVRIIREDETDEDKEESFDTGTITIGTYNDDGSDLDEVPDDGIFTAEIQLDHDPGVYLLQVELINEIFAREYQQYIQILPKPVRLSSEEVEVRSGKNKWFAELYIDDSIIDVARSHVKLTVFGPNHSMEEKVLSEIYAGKTLYYFESIDAPGDYRVQGLVFATTHEGREFRFDADSALFSVLPPFKPVDEEEIRRDEEEYMRAKEQAKKKNSKLYFIQAPLEEYMQELNELIYASKHDTTDTNPIEKESRRKVLQLIFINIAAFLLISIMLPVIIPKRKSQKSRRR